MKFLVLVLALFAVTNAKPWSDLFKEDPERSAIVARENFLVKKILELIEKLKSQMKEGIPDMGIPPLDPLQIANFSLGHVEVGDLLKIDKADFEDVTIQGLPNFTTEHVDANIFTMTVEIALNFKEIIVTGHYDLDAHLMDVVPFYGKGPFYLGLFDVFLDSKATIGTNDGKIFLEKFHVDAKLGKLNIHMDGLLGGGDLGEEMNELLQRVGTDMINKFLPQLADPISEFARLKINEAIKDIDLSDITG